MRWTATAGAGLEAAVDAYASLEVGSPRAALDAFSAFIGKVDSLGAFAERGRVMPELGCDEVREIGVFSHRVIYRVERDAVCIVAIVRGRQDPRGARSHRSS